MACRRQYHRGRPLPDDLRQALDHIHGRTSAHQVVTNQVSVGNVVVELIRLVALTALPKAYGLEVGGDPGVIQPGNQPSVGQGGNPRR